MYVWKVLALVLIASTAASATGTVYYYSVYHNETSRNGNLLSDNDTLTSEIHRLQSNVSNLNATIIGDKAQLDTLQTQLSGNLTQVQSLQSTVNHLNADIGQLQTWLAGNETELQNLEQYKTSTFVYGSIASNIGTIASVTFSHPTNSNNTFVTDYFAGTRSSITSYNVYLVTGVSYTVTITSNTGTICVANPYPLTPTGPSMTQNLNC